MSVDSFSFNLHSARTHIYGRSHVRRPATCAAAHLDATTADADDQDFRTLEQEEGKHLSSTRHACRCQVTCQGTYLRAASNLSLRNAECSASNLSPCTAKPAT